MTDAPQFDRTINPDRFTVGEMLTADGELGIILGFEHDTEWVGYRLHPRTAIEIVQALAAWLDQHAGDPSA